MRFNREKRWRTSAPIMVSLPLYLWEKGISPQVIMADISRGSLEKAAEKLAAFAPIAAFDLRLGADWRFLPREKWMLS